MLLIASAVNTVNTIWYSCSMQLCVSALLFAFVYLYHIVLRIILGLSEGGSSAKKILVFLVTYLRSSIIVLVKVCVF